MKKIRILFLTILFLGLFLLPETISAESYSFEVPFTEVVAYIEEDGTLSLEYTIDFKNMPNAPAIEYVDIGLPNQNFSMKSIEADIDGVPLTSFESTDYVDYGFAIALGSNAIQPGQSATITIWIPGIQGTLFPYDQDDLENYVNFQFTPNWFDPNADRSTSTEFFVTIVLPPGVGDEEGRYYYPENWPGSDDPTDIGRTLEGDRVYYSWTTNQANAHTEYEFGVAFPTTYVPEDAIVTSTGGGGGVFTWLTSIICGSLPCAGFFLVFAAIFGWGIYQGTVGAKKRKLAYLPPKMKIEGHGIKRGLTAVEAAILMEQPMDKIMTMILFGTLKKEAAVVVEEEPLKLEISDPLPENLHAYEVAFLEAFKIPQDKRRIHLQKMMVDLVNTVSSKMKGFSRKESIAYYEDIINRAWKMVEEAKTPEVKSENYNNTLEWTMLDKDYQERTQRTFTGSPVFVPMWWPRYSPVYRRSIGGTVSNPLPSAGKTASGGGKISLPHLPGSDFAAKVVNGVTGTAAGIVGNLTSFTDGVTSRTNPITISTSTRSSGSCGFKGGGGSSCACACACACAGCACACAGGGR